MIIEARLTHRVVRVRGKEARGGEVRFSEMFSSGPQPYSLSADEIEDLKNVLGRPGDIVVSINQQGITFVPDDPSAPECDLDVVTRTLVGRLNHYILTEQILGTTVSRLTIRMKSELPD